MDFGLLPPEINSGRMYSGAGPGPLTAAASAWQELATKLHSAAGGYSLAIADIGDAWHGPSADAMRTAALPYATWLSVTATQAEHTAAQAAAAVAAYEAAFAATVPPPVIAANRSLLLTLVATNFLGQNTPAIAATEAHYAEMWAQDASAMYGYAASSTAATRMSPFGAPPQTVDQAEPVGTAVSAIQSATSGLSTLLGNVTGAYSPAGWLSNVAVGWLSAMQILALAQNVPGVVSMLGGGGISGALGPLSGGFISLQTPLAGAAGAAGASLVSATPASTIPVSAAAGGAEVAGSLSVPPTWPSAAPAGKLVSAITAPAARAAAVSGAAGVSGLPESSQYLFGETALSSLAGRAAGGGAVRSMVGETRVIDKAPGTEELAAPMIFVIPASGE